MDIWIYGYTDIWIYGYVDLWIYGYMDIWIFGYLDIWMDINDGRIFRGGGGLPPSRPPPTPMGWVPQAGLGNLVEMDAHMQFSR